MIDRLTRATDSGGHVEEYNMQVKYQPYKEVVFTGDTKATQAHCEM